MFHEKLQNFTISYFCFNITFIKFSLFCLEFCILFIELIYTWALLHKNYGNFTINDISAIYGNYH